VSLINQEQLDSLKQLAGDDVDFLVSVIDAFLPQLDTAPWKLREALARADAQTLAEVAHSLKGSSSHVGAEGVSKLCLLIEKNARAGSLGGLAEVVDELTKAAAETCRLFEAEKARLV